MSIADELLSVLLNIIIIQAVIISIDGANQDEWSQIEPGFKCGIVPMRYKQLNNSSANTQLDHTGHNSHPGGERVLHGEDAKFGQWPWIVRLEFNDGDMEESSVCTGSLINSRWVLSAGHCGTVGEPSNWNAIFGLYNINPPDPCAIKLQIDKIIVHPNYSELNNDVALFQLSKPINYNMHIQPICLIGSTVELVSYARGKKCLALGYGRKINGAKPSKLQELRIVVHNISECVSDLGYNGKLKEGIACTGPVNGIGATCRGDSGGPNVCFNKLAARWELIGSVSYGPKLCDRREGDKWMTAVVDLTRYVKWIRETVWDGAKETDQSQQVDIITDTNKEGRYKVDE